MKNFHEMNNLAEKKVIACIIVRIKSTRLPRKALLDIEGKPMTLRIIERLRTAKTVDQIIICTSSHPDDHILVDLAKTDWGVEVIAGSELDVLSRLIEAANKFQADVVIRITGDNPFTDASIIDRMVKHHIATESDYTRTIGLPIGVTADIMSADMLPRLHKHMPNPNQSEYLSLFAMDHKHFHCELLDAPLELNQPFYSLTVDTPDDIKLARYLYKLLSNDGGIPALSDVIAELDANPDYKGISGETLVKVPGGEKKKYSELLDWWCAQRNMKRTE